MNTMIQDGNGNIIEQTVDHGDGTGTRTVYRPDGTVASTQALTGLPVEPPAETNRRTIEQRLRDDLTAMQTIIGTPNQSMDTAAIRQAIKAQARAMRRLIRHQRAAYDGTD